MQTQSGNRSSGPTIRSDNITGICRVFVWGQTFELWLTVKLKVSRDYRNCKSISEVHLKMEEPVEDQCSPRDQSARREAMTPTGKPHRLSGLTDDADAFYTPYDNSCFDTPSANTDRFFTPAGRTSSKLNLPVRVFELTAVNQLQGEGGMAAGAAALGHSPVTAEERMESVSTSTDMAMDLGTPFLQQHAAAAAAGGAGIAAAVGPHGGGAMWQGGNLEIMSVTTSPSYADDLEGRLPTGSPMSSVTSSSFRVSRSLHHSNLVPVAEPAVAAAMVSPLGAAIAPAPVAATRSGGSRAAKPAAAAAVVRSAALQRALVAAQRCSSAAAGAKAAIAGERTKRLAVPHAGVTRGGVPYHVTITTQPLGPSLIGILRAAA